MRVLVIVKATKDYEAGAMPKPELLAAMGKFNQELVKAGVMLDGQVVEASQIDAIATLPSLQRCLITLYYLEELSVSDIGAITDLPAGTIKSHLFRARKSLRDALESRLRGET